MISRLYQTSLRLNKIRSFSTQSNLLSSIQSDSSIKNLDSVLSQVKENNTKDVNVYDALIQKYGKLNDDVKCSEVFVTATYNGVEKQLSDESIRIFEVLSNAHLESNKNDFAFVKEDFKNYREALTRKN